MMYKGDKKDFDVDVGDDCMTHYVITADSFSVDEKDHLNFYMTDFPGIPVAKFAVWRNVRMI